MAPGAKLTPRDIYAFRTIPSSDGLDFYFTRQDPDSSLKNFVRNLKAGQSLLGSHNINTFAYGLSYDAALEDADKDAAYYEATFYSKHAKPDLATSKIVTSKSYMIRGTELNGQKTDDLIRGMDAGIIRKISISFSVGQYKCGIDGRDMLAGWGEQQTPIVPENGCRHFPGVEYKSDGLAWAWMRDGDLLEQSLVYKNASPSAMLIRKAETMAQRGLFSPNDLVHVEERLARRLPAYERTVFSGVKTLNGFTSFTASSGGDATLMVTPKLEDNMTMSRDTGEDEVALTPEQKDPEEAIEEAVAEAPTVVSEEPVVVPISLGLKLAVSAEVEQPAEEVAAEEVTEVIADASTEEPVAVGRAPGASPVPSPEERGALTVDLSRLAAFEARERAMTEALGGQKPTPTILRQMSRDADLGQKMFAQRVERAVAERIRAQGDGFSKASAERYREHLLSARTAEGDLDVDYIEEEIATWATAKESRFMAGRQVTPRDLPTPTASERKRSPERRIDYDPADNVLSNLDR